ncbi:MAG: hypothetical protein WD035_11490, partial [Balneolaceae bacterium]
NLPLALSLNKIPGSAKPSHCVFYILFFKEHEILIDFIPASRLIDPTGIIVMEGREIEAIY